MLAGSPTELIPQNSLCVINLSTAIALQIPLLMFIATAANSDVEASTTCLGRVSNIFDDLSSLAPPKVTDQQSKLDQYLSSDVKNVIDAL